MQPVWKIVGLRPVMDTTCSPTITLFRTTIKGNLVLYRILQAYNMFDMNVTGLVLLAVSIMYTTIVTNEDARASVIMAPDADHVNTSIWPGVSKIAYLEQN